MLDDINAEALEYLNMIRERAGLDMDYTDVTQAPYSGYSKDQWIDLIRNERRIEFAAEGLRYDDIIRWRIAEDVLNQPAEGHTRLVDGELQTLRIEERSFLPRSEEHTSELQSRGHLLCRL